MIKVKQVRPMFNRIVTTMDTYIEPEYVAGTNIIDTKKSRGSLKEYQKVIAVGPMVKNLKVGDLVCIDPKRYAVMKHNPGSLNNGVIKDNPVVGYNFDCVVIDGKDCLLLVDSDVSFVVESYEEVSD